MKPLQFWFLCKRPSPLPLWGTVAAGQFGVRVRTDIKTLFFRTFQTCKDQISGFSRTQKSVFKDFPGYTPFTNMVAWGEKVHIPNHFRCNCITVNKPKCNTCGDKMHTMYYNEFLLEGAILEPESKIFRTTTLEFQDFSGFSGIYTFSQDFPGLEISTF